MCVCVCTCSEMHRTRSMLLVRAFSSGLVQNVLVCVVVHCIPLSLLFKLFLFLFLMLMHGCNLQLFLVMYTAATCSILLVNVSFAGSSTLDLNWIPEPETASVVTEYDICTTQRDNTTCWTTTKTSSSVSDLESGEMILVQVRAHTTAGPGPFSNITVVEFPTVSTQVVLIVGGAALFAGMVLGMLILGLCVCLCISLCRRRRRRKR